MSDVVTKACVDNLAEAQEATSLMNFTVRRLEQRLKDAVCEVDEYRRAIVNLEAKIQRLEEAGDAMASAWDKEWLTDADIETIVDVWYGAKEAKP